MSFSDLKIGKVFSFNTTAPSVLGTSVKNATLVGILDYVSANSYENVDLKYRSVYPLLPNGTPDTPDNCIYYRFKAESGEYIVVADQWIQESTIEVIENITIQVVLTGVSLSDIQTIRNAINALGYTAYTIKQL